MAPKKKAAAPKAGAVQKRKPASKAAPKTDVPAADQTSGALTIERWCVTPCPCRVWTLLVSGQEPAIHLATTATGAAHRATGM